jgi:hypothetical protein
MAVRLTIPYETLVELVEQLPETQLQALVRHVQQRAQHHKPTVDEKMRLLKAAQIDHDINEEPSPRRLV